MFCLSDEDLPSPICEAAAPQNEEPHPAREPSLQAQHSSRGGDPITVSTHDTTPPNSPQILVNVQGNVLGNITFVDKNIRTGEDDEIESEKVRFEVIEGEDSLETNESPLRSSSNNLFEQNPDAGDREGESFIQNNSNTDYSLPMQSNNLTFPPPDGQPHVESNFAHHTPVRQPCIESTFAHHSPDRQPGIGSTIAHQPPTRQTHTESNFAHHPPVRQPGIESTFAHHTPVRQPGIESTVAQHTPVRQPGIESTFAHHSPVRQPGNNNLTFHPPVGQPHVDSNFAHHTLVRQPGFESLDSSPYHQESNVRDESDITMQKIQNADGEMLHNLKDFIKQPHCDDDHVLDDEENDTVVHKLRDGNDDRTDPKQMTDYSPTSAGCTSGKQKGGFPVQETGVHHTDLDNTMSTDTCFSQDNLQTMISGPTMRNRRPIGSLTHSGFPHSDKGIREDGLGESIRPQVPDAARPREEAPQYEPENTAEDNSIDLRTHNESEQLGPSNKWLVGLGLIPILMVPVLLYNIVKK